MTKLVSSNGCIAARAHLKGPLTVEDRKASLFNEGSARVIHFHILMIANT
jgi:hypothetical protein